jgi:hypothetical protein
MRAMAQAGALAALAALVSPATLVASATLATGAAGCSSTSTECDCVDPSLHLTVPPESAAGVTGVALTGSGCQGVTATCAQPAPSGGCADYRFTAAAAGTCHIEVTFANGVDAHDVTVVEKTGCCSGFFPDPAGSGEIAITPPASVRAATRAPGAG